MATVTASVPVRTSIRPSTAYRDPALDGLRGVAILLFAAYSSLAPMAASSGTEHVLGQLAAPAWSAGLLFLALSGYLLTGSVWETLRAPGAPHPAHWLRNFYVRRALLIFPLYYLILLAATLLAVTRGTPLKETGAMKLFAWFVDNLPFLTERAALQPSPLKIQYLWMVALPLQFACAWPLLMLATPGRRRALSLALGLATTSVVFCWIVWALPSMHAMVREHVFDEFSLTYASAFGLGAALYLARGMPLSEGLRVRLRQRLALGLALGIAGFCLAAVLEHGFDPATRAMFLLGIPSAGLASAALIGLALEAGRLRRALGTVPLVWFGRLSYGIFLLHPILSSSASKLAQRLTHTNGISLALAHFLLALVLDFALAFLLHELIERPFLALRRRFPLEHPRIGA